MSTTNDVTEQEAAGVGSSDKAPATGASPSAEGQRVSGPDEGQEAARLKEQLLRLAADFDNYRKRTRRDIEDAERRVQEHLVRSMLPAFDNLERALGHVDASQDVRALADGIQMVLRQLQDTLSGLGIERVPTVGKPFDPGLHEAVQQIENAAVPAGSVAVELQAGYSWKGKLLRPAMVVVSRGPGAN